MDYYQLSFNSSAFPAFLFCVGQPSQLWHLQPTNCSSVYDVKQCNESCSSSATLLILKSLHKKIQDYPSLETINYMVQSEIEVFCFNFSFLVCRQHLSAIVSLWRRQLYNRRVSLDGAAVHLLEKSRVWKDAKHTMFSKGKASKLIIFSPKNYSGHTDRNHTVPTFYLNMVAFLRIKIQGRLR